MGALGVVGVSGLIGYLLRDCGNYEIFHVKAFLSFLSYFVFSVLHMGGYLPFTGVLVWDQNQNQNQKYFLSSNNVWLGSYTMYSQLNQT